MEQATSEGRVKESIGKAICEASGYSDACRCPHVEPNLNHTRNSNPAEAHRDGTSNSLYPRKQHDATFQIDQGPKQPVTHRTEGPRVWRGIRKTSSLPKPMGHHCSPECLTGNVPF